MSVFVPSRSPYNNLAWAIDASRSTCDSFDSSVFIRESNDVRKFRCIWGSKMGVYYDDTRSQIYHILSISFATLTPISASLSWLIFVSKSRTNRSKTSTRYGRALG